MSVAVPTKWGFCFPGNEQIFTDTIVGSVQDGLLDYVEIGLGRGHTVAAVREICVQIPDLKWRLFGVDLPIYTGDATNPQEMPPEYVGVAEPELADEQDPSTISIYLCGSTVFLDQCRLSPHFIFIDACHGYACVVSDFLHSEKIISKGGIVCFHDTDTTCQGTGLQTHCNTGIDVRRALVDLGLMTNKRHGWEFVAESEGNHKKGGNGCVFVRRTDD